MKFDLHCHIKGGSIDSSIDIDEYVKILRSKGFGGMLVTDHDSYKGFNAWESEGQKYDDFTVLKGIEYDT
ncbi:MAG: PHP domain-containing protein, partial [[Eubacterium] sulci]|nr:PHP domain-containing protein [[Eubacterium] sulci]